MVEPNLILKALDFARLAPSAHNAQPWLVRREGDRLVVSADEARHLHHTDPTRRDLDLSLGAFTEALQISLAALGLWGTREPEDGAFAAISLKAGTPSGQELLSLIRRRQTSRLAYAPRFPESEGVVALESFAKSQGLRLHLLAKDTPERQRAEELFFAATRESWLDDRSVEELKKWIRFDPEGLLTPEDGLSTQCLGLKLPDAVALKAALQPGLWRALSKVFVAPVLAEQLAKEELKTVTPTPFLGVLISEGEANRAGDALFRVWLEATRLGFSFHPISVLLDRRGWELGKLIGAPPSSCVLAFRFGKSAPPPRSGRRTVEQFYGTAG
ncbi:MAG: hypothetical protein ACJ790_15030 [Myxococcaceae bacterium]